MGAGLDGLPSPNPSICEVDMFPPECLLLWPPPRVLPSPPAGLGATSPSFNLWGREVRLFTSSIVGMDDVAVTSSVTEDGRSGGEEKGKLVARRGGWRDDRLSLAVEYCREGWVVFPAAEVVVAVFWWCGLELFFWLSVPDSHLRRRRAENRFTRGGRFCGYGERERERERGGKVVSE